MERNTNTKFVVFDLDGTICNIDHRVAFAKAQQWDMFNSLCIHDEPNLDVLEFLSMASEHCKILIVTGRTENFRNVTEAWLRDHHVPYDKLLMRTEGDYTSSGLMKIGLLEEHFGGTMLTKQNVILALDDRDNDAKALRDYGINCWQVRSSIY